MVKLCFHERECCDFKADLPKLGDNSVSFDCAVFQHGSSACDGGLRDVEGFGELAVASV